MSPRSRWLSTSDRRGLAGALRRAAAPAVLAILAAACGATVQGDGASAVSAGDAVPVGGTAPAAAAAATAARAVPGLPAKAVPFAARPASAVAFNHQSHLGRGVGCLDCHEGADTKDRPGMPTLEGCMECHEEIEAEAPPEKKVAQFVDSATKQVKWSSWTRQGGDVRFSHAKHAAKKVECVSCHKGIDRSVRTDASLRQTMDDCTSCHTKSRAGNDCAVCHAKITRASVPASHGTPWRAAHGGVYRAGKPKDRWDDCSMCHEPAGCVECHQKTPPADHDRQFRYGPGHGAASAARADRCAMCHDDPAKCDQCHRVTTPLDHTPAWRGGPGHGIASESNRERCAKCHTETTCLTCHRDTAPRDHSQFWRVGPGHGLASAMDRERCAACHTSDQCVACHTSNPPRSHRGGWGAPRSLHCISCHEGPGSSGGCATCHTGTPSHRLAPAKPVGHLPDSECMLCHARMRHVATDQNCNSCHR